jgi:hypothetical protein
VVSSSPATWAAVIAALIKSTTSTIAAAVRASIPWMNPVDGLAPVRSATSHPQRSTGTCWYSSG